MQRNILILILFIDVHLVLIAMIYAAREVGVVLTWQRNFTVDVGICALRGKLVITISWVHESNGTQHYTLSCRIKVFNQ